MEIPAVRDEAQSSVGSQRGSAADILPPRFAAGMAGGLLALFAVLTAGVAMKWTPLASLDHTVAQWAYDRTYGHPTLSHFWLTVTTVGQPWGPRLIILAAAAFHAWRRRWSIVGWLLATILVELVVAPSAKYLLSRPRPYWKNPITLTGGLGYPSGHSAAAAMFVTTMTLLLLTTVSPRPARSLSIGAAIVVGVLVPASRIFLGVHYLTDVVAGLLLGAAISLLTWTALARHMPRTSLTPRR